MPPKNQTNNQNNKTKMHTKNPNQPTNKQTHRTPKPKNKAKKITSGKKHQTKNQKPNRNALSRMEKEWFSRDASLMFNLEMSIDNLRGKQIRSIN